MISLVLDLCFNWLLLFLFVVFIVGFLCVILIMFLIGLWFVVVGIGGDFGILYCRI